MQNIFASEQTADDMARLVREQRLGEAIGEYEVLGLTRTWRVRYLLLLGALGAEGVLLLISLLQLIFESNVLPIDGSFSLLNFWVPLCHLVFLTMAILTFMNKEYKLCVYTEGCVFRRSTKKSRVIRWQEIEHIWCTVAHTPRSFFKVHRLYTLQSHDGRTLMFCGKVPALSEFDQRIDEHYTQRRLPAVLSDYQAGHSLHFGELALNLDGITTGNRTFAWEQVGNISLQEERRLVISTLDGQHAPWLKIATSKMPDLPLLLALLAHIHPAQPAPDEPTTARTTSQESQVAVEKHAAQVASYGWQAQAVETSGQLFLSKLRAKREPGPATQKLRRRLTEIPDDLLALALEHRLGARRTDGRFGISTIMIWPFIVAQVIACLIFTVFSFIMVHVIFSPQLFDPGWEQILDAIMRDIVWFFIGLIWLGFFLPVMLHFHHYTYTFEQGLILKRGRRATIICRWDEVEAVWRATFLGKWPVYFPPLFAGYTLHMRDGSRLALSRFDVDLEAFSRIVREQITPLQLPVARSAYQSGQKLSFGPLHISQAGIEQGMRLLPWPQVKSVMLEANTLAIYDLARRKPWCAAPAACVPNLYVLFALADDARGYGERS